MMPMQRKLWSAKREVRFAFDRRDDKLKFPIFIRTFPGFEIEGHANTWHTVGSMEPKSRQAADLTW
jgi:hypothetical protein